MNASSLPLAGRHAVLAGAGRGAGPALAAALVQQGARLTLLGHDADRLKALSLQLAATGVLLQGTIDDGKPQKVAIVRGEQTVRWQALADTSECGIAAVIGESVRQSGPIDVLIHNSGTVEPSRLEETDLALWSRMLDANLTLPFLLTKACIPAMRQRGWGRIVSLNDVAATRQRAGYVAYRTAREGLTGFISALAAELDGSGITLNSIEASLPDDRSAPTTPTLLAMQAALVRQAIAFCLPDNTLSGQHVVVPAASDNTF